MIFCTTIKTRNLWCGRRKSVLGPTNSKDDSEICVNAERSIPDTVLEMDRNSVLVHNVSFWAPFDWWKIYEWKYLIIVKKIVLYYYLLAINSYWFTKKKNVLLHEYHYKKVDYDNEIESHKIYFDAFLSNSLETRLML